jgi:aspartate kinase
MHIMKFGGTSVGTPERMNQVREIITMDDQRKIVVLSALSGTTNALTAFAKDLKDVQTVSAKSALTSLRKHYEGFIRELYDSNDYHTKARNFINQKWQYFDSLLSKAYAIEEEKIILAQGELISTQLFVWHLQENGIQAALLPALQYMRIDKGQEPDDFYIQSMLEKEMERFSNIPVIITQGYICRNAFGEVDNLKRGGSDYTATLIGLAIEAEEIQIWTDIDGMHNNDPRVVDKTFPIKHLSYDEASELAYFGAKILHPSCVLPAQKGNVPIRLKNTMDPQAAGTLISDYHGEHGITALAAKDGITAIKIKSGRMLNAYGFLKKVFEIFEKYETPIDMITTSEVAISLTIDHDKHLDNILSEIRNFGRTEVDREQTIICVVGDLISDKSGYAIKIFSALKDIPIRMISYGGSKYNVSVLVQSSYKKEALQALNQSLFGL